MVLIIEKYGNSSPARSAHRNGVHDGSLKKTSRDGTSNQKYDEADAKEKELHADPRHTTTCPGQRECEAAQELTGGPQDAALASKW